MKIKNYALCALVLLALLLTGCGDDDGTTTNGSIVDPSEPQFDVSLQPETIDGTRWKLTNVSIFKDYQLFETIDVSEGNIVYEFLGEGRLVITGNTDYLSIFNNLDILIFDYFKEGEHAYTYVKPMVCPLCLPGPNLTINNPVNENGVPQNTSRYYCLVRSDNEAMRISSDGALVGDVFYGWTKTYIRLSN